MSKIEDDLEDKGYVFTGHYSSDNKEEMKKKAAIYRSYGFKARVVTTVSRGRVYSTTGWSVYVKDWDHVSRYEINVSKEPGAKDA